MVALTLEQAVAVVSNALGWSTVKATALVRSELQERGDLTPIRVGEFIRLNYPDRLNKDEY